VSAPPGSWLFHLSRASRARRRTGAAGVHRGGHRNNARVAPTPRGAVIAASVPAHHRQPAPGSNPLQRLTSTEEVPAALQALPSLATATGGLDGRGGVGARATASRAFRRHSAIVRRRVSHAPARARIAHISRIGLDNQTKQLAPRVDECPGASHIGRRPGHPCEFKWCTPGFCSGATDTNTLCAVTGPGVEVGSSEVTASVASRQCRDHCFYLCARECGDASVW